METIIKIDPKVLLIAKLKQAEWRIDKQKCANLTLNDGKQIRVNMRDSSKAEYQKKIISAKDGVRESKWVTKFSSPYDEITVNKSKVSKKKTTNKENE